MKGRGTATTLLLACWLVPLLGCDPPGKPNPADRPQRPSDVMDFTKLFSQNCAGCHGADGELGPAPPINDPLFRSAVSSEELLKVITSGRPGTLMPGFGRSDVEGLTPAQIQLLVYAIRGVPYAVTSRSLPNGSTEYAVNESSDGYVAAWGLLRPLPSGVPPLIDTEAQENAQVERGATIFARACAACHGTQGQGGSGEKGAGAINEPALLSLTSDQALRRIIITGRSDLGMPNFAGKAGRAADFQPLTSQDVADLVALLASWREPTNIDTP